MFIHNLKLILRSLKKNRLYSFLNISGFAIGFAVVLTISLFIYREKTVDRTFEGYNRIYRLISSDENDSFIRYEVAQELMRNYPEVESATPVQYLSGWEFTVGSGGNFAILKDLVSTDNRFFTIFGLKLIEGFSSEPFAEKNSAVVSKRLAEALFGEASPLGRNIDVGGFMQTRITGVVDDFPENTSFYSDLYLHIGDEKLRIMQSGDNGVLWNPGYIFIRMAEGLDGVTLNNKLSKAEIMLTHQEGTTWLQPLKDIYFGKNIKNNTNKTVNTFMVYLFGAIAGLILLLSVFNHINFSFSLQVSRLRATGIKKSHGAGFRQLAYFHLMENTIGVLLSLIISVIIVIEILPLAGQLFERNLDVLSLTRYPVNLLTMIIILTVIILTSIVPLYLIGQFDIRKFISGSFIRPKGSIVNNILSVFQAAVTIALIVSLITIYKQLSYAKQTDTGFDKERLIRIKLPGDFDKGHIVKQELSRFQFVKSSTLSLGVPGMINSRVGSGENDNQFWLDCIEVDEDFIGTFGLNLLAGRNFLPGDEDKGCIINQTALKKFGWDNIENKEFKQFGLQVIGIVNDFHVSSLRDVIEPAVLVFKNRYKNTLTLRLEPGNTGQQIGQLKDAWNVVIPDYMFDFVFFDEFFSSYYQKEERLALVLTIFSVLALLITLMGMTGWIFQTCLIRTKEIGIRKINGAKISEIILMLNMDVIRRVSVAFIIAVPVSYFFMQKWLQNFAYRTEQSWWIFILAGALTLFIALLTISWQSWRAATRNPVEALRYE